MLFEIIVHHCDESDRPNAVLLQPASQPASEWENPTRVFANAPTEFVALKASPLDATGPPRHDAARWSSTVSLRKQKRRYHMSTVLLTSRICCLCCCCCYCYWDTIFSYWKKSERWYITPWCMVFDSASRKFHTVSVWLIFVLIWYHNTSLVY